MVAVEGIVAEVSDPEGMHRIRVVIPSMDESIVHDEWVCALVPWVGSAGFGPVNLPEVGSEVLLFGRLGQKHSLFYLCRFNEDFIVPGEFIGDEARGLKTDGRYKLLAELLLEVISQTQVLVKGGSLAEVDAPNVKLKAGGNVAVHAQGSKVGFLGAAPVARQTLPAPATDLASCIALTNALRAALIALGLGQ
ncbi:MAG: phage baseplate assembly protein V [Pyrinomonadaceae bacterium]